MFETRDWSDLEEKGRIGMVEARDWLESKGIYIYGDSIKVSA